MATLGHYLSIGYGNELGIADYLNQITTLDKQRKNVILVFPGSFNPPHRSHLALLYHTYEQLASKLNIVGAMVKPLPDTYIQNKHLGNGSTAKCVILLRDRARLWKEDPYFPPWAWVYEGVKWGSYTSFRDKLKALAKEDGYSITYAGLYGPDCINFDDWEELQEMTITSDIARKADYDLDLDQRLENPSQYGLGVWHVANGEREGIPLDLQPEGARQNERDDFPGKDHNSIFGASAGLSQKASALAAAKVDELLGLKLKVMALLPPHLAMLRSTKSTSICWRPKVGSEQSIHILRATSAQSALFRGISSSRIHKTIGRLKGYKLRPALEFMALSPGLLWNMLLPYPFQQRERPDDNEETITHVCTGSCIFRPKAGRHLQHSIYGAGIYTLDDIVVPPMIGRRLHGSLCGTGFLAAAVEQQKPVVALDDMFVNSMNAGGLSRMLQRRQRRCCRDSMYDEIVDIDLRETDVLRSLRLIFSGVDEERRDK